MDADWCMDIGLAWMDALTDRWTDNQRALCYWHCIKREVFTAEIFFNLKGLRVRNPKYELYFLLIFIYTMFFSFRHNILVIFVPSLIPFNFLCLMTCWFDISVLVALGLNKPHPGATMLFITQYLGPLLWVKLPPPSASDNPCQGF